MEQSHSLFLSFRFENPSCAFGAALLQGPAHRADSLSFPFIPLRGSILRLWRGPSPRAYSWSGVTLFFFHSASRNPSCAFGAVLFQGPTQRADSLSFPFILPRGSILRLWRGPSPRAYSWSGVLSFPFIPLRGSILCLRRGLSPRAYSWSGVLSFPFIPLRGIILRLWRAPSSRGYSISKTPFFHLNPSHQSLVTSHQSLVTSHQSLVTPKRKRASLR